MLQILDFLIAEPTRLKCPKSFSTLPLVFMPLQAPAVASKTLSLSQELEFIGIVLDSIRIDARLPDDKLKTLNRTRKMLNSFTQRRSVRLFELQSRIGTLQFACKAVVPRRTFLQRMTNLTKRVLSRFHHISLVAIISSGHSKAPRIIDLLRFLVLISMKHNFHVREDFHCCVICTCLRA